MENKKAVIFGCNGQDGSFLTELLLEKSYKVIGVKRRSSTPTLCNLQSSLANPALNIIEGEITDPSSVNQIISTYRPNECYNLSAQSHVGTSFNQPSYTFTTNAIGPLLILDAIKNYSPETKFYQASTSEMFGSNYSIRTTGEFKGVNSTNSSGYDNWPDCLDKYQDENTALSPNSPYAIAKTAAHHTVRMYRDAYGIFACAGILFNHESERRGENFVTRKITKYIGKLINKHKDCYGEFKGKDEYNNDIHILNKLKLGNIDTIRDWGYAPDYVKAMWMMLQYDKPDDYIIGTGEGHTVKEFLIEAFKYVNINNWESFVTIDKSLYRPSEVPYLKCNASKAKTILEWEAKVTFKELVQKMVEHDLNDKDL